MPRSAACGSPNLANAPLCAGLPTPPTEGLSSLQVDNRLGENSNDARTLYTQGLELGTVHRHSALHLRGALQMRLPFPKPGSSGYCIASIEGLNGCFQYLGEASGI